MWIPLALAAGALGGYDAAMARYGKRWLTATLPEGVLRAEERIPAERAAKRLPREADVLAACLALCKRHPRVAWVHRVNVGAARAVDRHGKARFIRFMWLGAADISGQMRDGRRLEIECKRPGQRETAAQAEFLSLVAAHGGVACCVDGVDALKRVLDRA